MTTPQDPFNFAAPASIASTFASADSFRGRLVLIEPTRIELDVPNQMNPGQVADKVTATVTTVDGLGPVQIYSQKVPVAGKFLQGPEHKGVWFSQQRIVLALLPNRVLIPGHKVLARLETYKPGMPAGQGNPWGLVNPSDADYETARKFYAEFIAGRMVGGATAPAAQAPVQAAPAFTPQAAPPVPQQYAQAPVQAAPQGFDPNVDPFSDNPPF